MCGAIIRLIEFKRLFVLSMWGPGNGAFKGFVLTLFVWINIGTNFSLSMIICSTVVVRVLWLARPL